MNNKSNREAERPLIAIIGPTACGKTRRAVEVASHFNGEIISGDSRQVYIGMDLGTGKDIEEYGNVKVHLLDMLPAGEKYDLHQFLADFRTAYDDIILRGKTPILCGGSGMYVEAALNGLLLPEVPPNHELRDRLQNLNLDELTDILKGLKRLHNTTDVDSVKRAIRAIEIEQYYIDHPEESLQTRVNSAEKPESIIIGLDISRDERRTRITKRLYERLEAGMVREIEHLIGAGVKPENLIYYGLEYKYLTMYVLGQLTYQEMCIQLETAIHQFAKRQMTWFRGMERRGHKIVWLTYDMPTDEFLEAIKDQLKKYSSILHSEKY